MVSIFADQKNTNLKDELLTLPRQDLRASLCEQQYIVALRIQETRSLAKTLWEFGQSISTKHLLFSLSRRLRKFLNYFEVLLLNSLIYSSGGAESLQRLP